MAIFKSVINVNNGNTGWTRQHVLDALETAFSQLGYNGGSAVAGSPVAFQAPGNGATGIGNTNWAYCGGFAPAISSAITRYFYVTNNGTSSYNLLEQWYPSNLSTANDTLTLTQHILQTGNPVRWNPGGAVTGTSITGLTNDTTYYVIRVDGNTIKLAATLDDATNGIAVNITGSVGNYGLIPLRREFNVLYNNYQIDVEMGDTLTFLVNDTTSGGQFFLIDSPTTGYAANRVLNTTNFQAQSYQVFPTGQGTSTVSWYVEGWPQTETEIVNPGDALGGGISGVGYTGRFSYGYGNSANPSMRGEIRILPALKSGNQTNFFPYWKYTIPASGGRSSLKIRVHRFPEQYGSSWRRSVAGITIHSIGSGWSNNESFTIPGSAIGGVDISNDILVGTNSLTGTQQSNYNGVCNLMTTNYGAGSTMYQKSNHGHFAVLKNVNDANKTFGTTFYGFGLDANNYRMYLSSGPAWISLDRLGTNANYLNGTYDYGFYGGDRGLDYQESSNYITTDSANWTYIDYATSSTPTAYPLSIRVYKAQSPQDINFAVIQFTQTINNTIIPFGTFTIHRGSGFGANIWDLNHVWNGGLSTYTASGRTVTISHNIAANTYYWNNTQVEPAGTQSLAREANYGYMRNSSSNGYQIPFTTYQCNIDTYNETYYNNPGLTYYRNSTYDRFTDGNVYMNYADRLKIVSSSANYYKPIKGIPICNQLVPCPYYIPDDFIMLQVSTSPGLTQFRPGDTITVSPSEVYEIILAGYQTSQNGLDGVNNNSSMGMLFCARTT